MKNGNKKTVAKRLATSYIASVITYAITFIIGGLILTNDKEERNTLMKIGLKRCPIWPYWWFKDLSDPYDIDIEVVRPKVEVEE